MWHGSAILLAVVAQHVLRRTLEQPGVVWLAALTAVTLAAVAIGILAVAKRPGQVVGFLVSTPFIVVNLTAITISTILGTMILQRLPPTRFGSLYGSLSGPLRMLFLDDLFHSIWFNTLVMLCAIALALIAIKRWPWSWKQIGYVAAHLGIVIALAGAGVGQLFGVRGRLDLEVGQTSNRLMLHDWRSGQRREEPLPFSVRLDDFHIDTYDPVHRIYVFVKSDVHGQSDDDFTPLLSIDPKEQRGQEVKIGSGFALKVTSYDEARTAETPAADNHVLVIEDKPYVVEPGRLYKDLDGWQIRVGEFFPHFNYNIEKKQPVNLSRKPNNPALFVEIRRAVLEQAPQQEAPGPIYQGWLFANMPGFAMSHQKDEEPKQKVPVYRFLGGSQAEGARVKLLLTQPGGEAAPHELNLQPGQHMFNFGDGRYVAVLRLRKDEVKNYYASLSILEENRAVQKKRIYVNDPLSYAGYALYQSNYDPENLRYSGLEVVRDPGLWLVYVGLTSMFFGVVQIFYLRTLGRRRREAA